MVPKEKGSIDVPMTCAVQSSVLYCNVQGTGARETPSLLCRSVDQKMVKITI